MLFTALQERISAGVLGAEALSTTGSGSTSQGILSVRVQPRPAPFSPPPSTHTMFFLPCFAWCACVCLVGQGCVAANPPAGPYCTHAETPFPAGSLRMVLALVHTSACLLRLLSHCVLVLAPHMPRSPTVCRWCRCCWQDHAYGVFDMVEVGDIQLLHIRNPWVVKEGVPEWSGDWSDHSPLWAANPDVAAACSFTVGAAPLDATVAEVAVREVCCGGAETNHLTTCFCCSVKPVSSRGHVCCVTTSLCMCCRALWTTAAFGSLCRTSWRRSTLCTLAAC